MGKKKKIREEFEELFKQGDEKAIKKMLDKNPWLLNEMETSMDEGMAEQNQIIAALGVMEDELSNPAPLEEISFCLRVDFKNQMDDGQINTYLEENQSLGLCRRVGNGWQLTPDGEKKVDIYLNAHAI